MVEKRQDATVARKSMTPNQRTMSKSRSLLAGPARAASRSHRLHRVRCWTRGYAAPASPAPEIYDVVCVGGGPAGLSLLAGLRSSPATAGLKVALIEGQDIRRNNEKFNSDGPFSNRCSSLTPASVAHLKDIGAWPLLEKHRVQPYHEMQVWDGVTGSRISFDWAGPSQGLVQSPDPTGTIAYMIENNNLTKALFSRLSALGGCAVLSPARVASIDLGADRGDLDLRSWPVVTLDDGRTLAARLLVGADGANSPVRAFAGIASRGWDYG
ncbi:MAG: FAD-dependent monooxygenase, partial [Terriglobus roseus]|nr:FAD-dependent monooxygenase [Terriglobus roseus]